MTPYIWLIPLGFITGAYATLVGLGGGFIMVPVLLIIYPDAGTEIITSISLAVVFVNGLSGTWAYARMKRIDYRSGLIFSLATIPGAVLGATFTAFIPRQLFELIFGLLLILISGFIFINPDQGKKKRTDPSETLESEEDSSQKGLRFNPFVGVGVSIGVGFISSLFGIGGGLILLPLMVYALHFPVYIATATSMFIIAIAALSGTITHVVSGSLDQGIWQVVFLSTGAVFGAQLGAWLSTRLASGWIIRALALALGITGIKFIWSAVM